MATDTKISPFGITKLNNAEYTNFMQRLYELALIATAEKLGLDDALLRIFGGNIELMTDIVAQSRISDQTAQIAAIDKEADALIVYLMAAFRTAKASPLTAQRTAALTLYNATHPYIGCQNLPQGQQIQAMRGLVADLSKPDLAKHVKTLGLDPVVEQLSSLTSDYAALIDARAASQTATRLDAGKTVRQEMDPQYDEIVTRAFVASVATPSAEAAAFVTAVNKLIADTDAAYNQRLAQTHAAAEKKKKGEEKTEGE